MNYLASPDSRYRLKTERAIRLELNGGHLPGLVDSKQLIQTVRDYDKDDAKRAKAAAKGASIIDHLTKADELLGMKTPIDSPFCNPTLTTAGQTPRSAACPCGSGEKFKHCCGKDAPPVLGRAA
jgi:hypothetical protein